MEIKSGNPSVSTSIQADETLSWGCGSTELSPAASETSSYFPSSNAADNGGLPPAGHHFLFLSSSLVFSSNVRNTAIGTRSTCPSEKTTVVACRFWFSGRS